MNPASSTSTFADQVSSNDMLCKKLLHELLKNQSVASWAASAIQSDAVHQTSRRGQPIVGRKQDSAKPDGEALAPPQLDQLTLASVLQSLATVEKSKTPSDSGSDTTSEFSMMSVMARPLDRSISMPGDANTGIRGMNMERYKTELCRQHQETGFCKYGAKCQFAHGRSELKVVSRHPKYKTEMCKTYHTTGLCPYGTRCHFIHDEEEMIRQQMLKQRSRGITQRNAVSRHVSLPIGGHRRRDSKTFNPAVGSFSDMCLGSVGDTPPSSISSSPAPSPTAFLYEERTQSLPLPSASVGFVAPPPGFHSPPATAPPSVSPVFNFNKEVTSGSSFSDAIPAPFSMPQAPVNSLAAGLQAAVSNNSLHNSGDMDLVKDCFSDFYYMPSTPPMCGGGGADSDTDSNICESPMDVSRSLRLPIFSQMSKE